MYLSSFLCQKPQKKDNFHFMSQSVETAEAAKQRAYFLDLIKERESEMRPEADALSGAEQSRVSVDGWRLRGQILPRFLLLFVFLLIRVASIPLSPTLRCCFHFSNN